MDAVLATQKSPKQDSLATKTERAREKERDAACHGPGGVQARCRSLEERQRKGRSENGEDKRL